MGLKDLSGAQSRRSWSHAGSPGHGPGLDRTWLLSSLSFTCCNLQDSWSTGYF